MLSEMFCSAKRRQIEIKYRHQHTKMQYILHRLTKLPIRLKRIDYVVCHFIAVALHFESSIAVMHTQIEFQVTQTGFFPLFRSFVPSLVGWFVRSL